MKRKKPRKKLKVYNSKGELINSERQQVKEITNLFKETFEQENQGTLKHYPPCENPNPLTGVETHKAAKKLKKGRKPGIDYVYPEYLKYASMNVHDKLHVF